MQMAYHICTADKERDHFMANTTTNFNDRMLRPDQPNKETIAAMLEAERIARDPNVKHYSDVEEALRKLKR